MPLRSSRQKNYLIALTLLLAALAPATAQQPFRTQKGTEIVWDKWGVPHVFARSIPDMFFCYGYAQAEAHGDLLLRMYGNSRGRASEYFGPGENDRNLRSDRWVWLNEVPVHLGRRETF